MFYIQYFYDQRPIFIVKITYLSDGDTRHKRFNKKTAIGFNYHITVILLEFATFKGWFRLFKAIGNHFTHVFFHLIDIFKLP